LLETTLPVGQSQPFGRQIFPSEGGTDGFFYALLGQS